MCLKQVESLLIGGQSGTISKLVLKSKILGQGKGTLVRTFNTKNTQVTEN